MYVKDEGVIPNFEEIINNLPMLPDVARRIIELDEDDMDYYEQLLEIAGTDPTICAMVFRVANSAAYATHTPVTDLPQAMMRVGTRAVIEAVMARGFSDLFTPQYSEERMLWRHSVRAAVAARLIAYHNPLFGIKPNTAYTAALLHDIGSFLLLKADPQSFAGIEAFTAHEHIEKVEAEKASIGWDHAKVGLRALEYWDFSDELKAVIEHHHDYTYVNNPDVFARMRYLVFIVQMGDFIASLDEVNTDFYEWDLDAYEAMIEDKLATHGWDTAGLNVNKTARYLGKMKIDVERAFEMMGLNEAPLDIDEGENV